MVNFVLLLASVSKMNMNSLVINNSMSNNFHILFKTENNLHLCWPVLNIFHKMYTSDLHWWMLLYSFCLIKNKIVTITLKENSHPPLQTENDICCGIKNLH